MLGSRPCAPATPSRFRARVSTFLYRGSVYLKDRKRHMSFKSTYILYQYTCHGKRDSKHAFTQYTPGRGGDTYLLRSGVSKQPISTNPDLTSQERVVSNATPPLRKDKPVLKHTHPIVSTPSCCASWSSSSRGSRRTLEERLKNDPEP